MRGWVGNCVPDQVSSLRPFATKMWKACLRSLRVREHGQRECIKAFRAFRGLVDLIDVIENSLHLRTERLWTLERAGSPRELPAGLNRRDGKDRNETSDLRIDPAPQGAPAELPLKSATALVADGVSQVTSGFLFSIINIG